MSDTTPGEAGWQADPTGKHDHRYWDGSQWTDNVSDAGVASTDPYVPSAATPPSPTDPTVTEPVAMTPPDPTASFTAGGSPPPPAPLPAAANDGSGGSKKGLLIGAGILIIVAIIVAALALGGDDDGKDDDAAAIRTQLVDAIKTNTPFTSSEAECVADYVIDNVDHDTLAGLDYESATVPHEISDEFNDGIDECNAGGDDATTTTGSGDDSTTTTESSGDTDGVTDLGVDNDAYKELLVQQLTAAGLDDDQASCLADRMIDAIQSGDLSESDAFSNLQEFFSDCDIDPSSLGN